MALELGLACGGWCPAGRWAEDGPISERYPLTETESADPAVRTALNVRDSDATLVLTEGEPSGGTALTIEAAEALGRPLLVLDLADSPEPAAVARWIAHEKIRTLNVAGPRESEAPGIHARAAEFLCRALSSIDETK